MVGAMCRVSQQSTRRRIIQVISQTAVCETRGMASSDGSASVDAQTSSCQTTNGLSYGRRLKGSIGGISSECRPPREAGAGADPGRIVGEGAAAFAQDAVEIIQGFNVLVGDRFAQRRPEMLSRLQFG